MARRFGDNALAMEDEIDVRGDLVLLASGDEDDADSAARDGEDDRFTKDDSMALTLDFGLGASFLLFVVDSAGEGCCCAG